MTPIKNIAYMLESAGSIAIIPHVSVDGDGLGSSLALGIALKMLGKRVIVLLEEDVPSIYRFLPGKELIELYNGASASYHTAVALDAGDIKRLGSRADVFFHAEMTINIDHHVTNEGFGKYNIVRTESAAVGEIIFRLLGTMGVRIDAEIATCLYVAIATDTGGFRYSNTTPTTHRIAADLIKSGIDVAEISRKVFDTFSLEKVKLMGMAINSLELHGNGKIAFLTLTPEMMSKAGAREEDSDGIVNVGRNLQGVEVAVLLKDMGNGEVKVNLRSDSLVDVSAVASVYSGGGHKRAAGFTVKGGINETKANLLKVIEDALKTASGK